MISRKIHLTHTQVVQAARRLADDAQKQGICFDVGKSPCVYGVPRGGIPVAYLMKEMRCHIVDRAEEADFIVDDIIDSGRTRDRYLHHNVPILALASYLTPPREKGDWIVFPWEVTDLHSDKEDGDTSADDIIVRLLQYIGEDPTREGLQETPKRVLKAWKEWTAGYSIDPATVFKVFADGGENYDEMVVVKNLPFYSHCEHHLAPFFGTATIAYIPNKKVVGLSKLGRILHVFSKRLQVQERLTTQIADAISNHLLPKGVGVLVRARHLCMESRGIACQGHETVTSALRGALLTNAAARQEFLSISR